MNRLDKTVSVVIASVVLLSACSNSSKTDETVVPSDEETVIETTAEATPTPEPTNTPTPTPTVYSIDGDYIVFGRYEQDGNLDNGPEPIEWEIVSEEDGRMLLISRYILDCKPYNTSCTDVTWETCSLREWLNNDFFNSAFSETEQNQLLLVMLSTSDNEFESAEGGNDTEDKVFCLSVDEVLEYYQFEDWFENDGWGYSEALINTELTPYAASLCTYTDGIWRHWWLRSPSPDSHVCCVLDLAAWDADHSDQAVAGWTCVNYVDNCSGVRPAIYLSVQE